MTFAHLVIRETGEVLLWEPDTLVGINLSILPVTGITAASAVFAAIVSPNGETGTLNFEWTSQSDVSWQFPVTVLDEPYQFSGTGPLSFSARSGKVFLPNGNYKVRGRAQVGGDTIVTGDQNFTVLQPVLVCSTPTSILETSCVFEGSILPLEAVGEVSFEWTLETDLNWRGAVQVPVPAIAFSGTTLVPLSVGSGAVLVGGTNYKCRLKAIVGVEVLYSNEVLFMSAAPPPDVSCFAPSSITSFSCMFEGEIDPNGGIARWSFEWTELADTGWLNPRQVPIPAVTVSGGTPILVFQPSGAVFDPASDYRIRLKANAGGSTYYSTPDVTFTTDPVTPNVPDLSCEDPIDITAVGCTFIGSILPNGAVGDVSFEYTLQSDVGWSSPTQVPVVPIPFSGGSVIPLSVPSGVLTMGSAYKCRLKAVVGVTTYLSAEVLFNTLLPVLTCALPSPITAASCTFLGSLQPNGTTGTWFFQYTLQSDTLWASPINVPVGGTSFSGTSVLALSQPSGLVLDPLTAYKCRLRVVVGATTFFSSPDILFSTIGLDLLCATPVSITAASCTFRGSIQPNMAVGSTAFQYTLQSDTFWSSAVLVPPGGIPFSGSALIPLSEPGVTLQPAQAYKVRQRAVVGAQIFFSTEVLFNSLAPILNCTAVTLITPNSCTFNGTVDPLGATGTANFQYTTQADTGWGSPQNVSPSSPFTGSPITMQTPSGAVLSSGVQYKARIRVVIGAFTFFSNDVFFTAGVATSPPSVVTLTASPVNQNDATMRANVTVPAGGAPNGNTFVYFRHGPSTGNYTGTTPIQNCGFAQTVVLKVATLTQLSPGQTVFFQAFVYNSVNGPGAPIGGGEQNFTTNVVPPTGVPVPADAVAAEVGATMMHMHGTVNLDGTGVNATSKFQWIDLDAVPPQTWGEPNETVITNLERLYADGTQKGKQKVGEPIYFLTPGHRIQWHLLTTNAAGSAVTSDVTTTLKVEGPPHVYVPLGTPNPPNLSQPNNRPGVVNRGTDFLDSTSVIVYAGSEHGGLRHWGMFEIDTNPAFTNPVKSPIWSCQSHTTSLPATGNWLIPNTRWAWRFDGLNPSTQYWWRFTVWNRNGNEVLPTQTFTTDAASLWTGGIDNQKPAGWLTETLSDVRDPQSVPISVLDEVVFGDDDYIALGEPGYNPNNPEHAYTVLVTPTLVTTTWNQQTYAVSDSGGGMRAMALALRLVRSGGIIRPDSSLGHVYAGVSIGGENGSPKVNFEGWWQDPPYVFGQSIPAQRYLPITNVRIQPRKLSAGKFIWRGYSLSNAHGGTNGILVKGCIGERKGASTSHGTYVFTSGDGGGRWTHGRITFYDSIIRAEDGEASWEGYGAKTGMRMGCPVDLDVRRVDVKPMKEHSFYNDSMGAFTGRDHFLIDCRVEGAIAPYIQSPVNLSTYHEGELATRNTQCQFTSRGDEVRAGVGLASGSGFPPSRGTIYMIRLRGRSGDS